MPSVPRCAFPAFIPPLRPSLTDAPPAGDGWLHEIKHDGFRTMLVLGEGTARAFTMNGHDWSDRYRGLVAAAGGLGRRAAVIDGEAVVQRPDGVADFGALREALARRPHRAAGGDDGIVLFAFDLLHLDGADFRSRPLEERRACCLRCRPPSRHRRTT